MRGKPLSPPVRTAVLTSLAMIAFASNNLLTRGALEAGLIDAPTFALIRLASGAAFLGAWQRVRAGPVVGGGSWAGAVALAGYAIAFTAAYTRVAAGTGALLLFGAVQVTMIGTGLAKGERPGARAWLGIMLAIAGLALLTLPGATAPAPTGAALMLVAGMFWGAYSLVGRDSHDPLAATSSNFWRASVLTLVMLAWFVQPERITPAGVGLAVVCGALASGVGYTIWYGALAGLSRWRASLVQLTAPILTALAATVLLDEAITLRLAAAAALVAAGMWLGGRDQQRLTKASYRQDDQ
ncbi:MAG: DMT family transporter [Gemmatimonadales bacterium]